MRNPSIVEFGCWNGRECCCIDFHENCPARRHSQGPRACRRATSLVPSERNPPSCLAYRALERRPVCQLLEVILAHLNTDGLPSGIRLLLSLDGSLQCIHTCATARSVEQWRYNRSEFEIVQLTVSNMASSRMSLPVTKTAALIKRNTLNQFLILPILLFERYWMKFVVCTDFIPPIIASILRF